VQRKEARKEFSSENWRRGDGDPETSIFEAGRNHESARVIQAIGAASERIESSNMAFEMGQMPCLQFYSEPT